MAPDDELHIAWSSDAELACLFGHEVAAGNTALVLGKGAVEKAVVLTRIREELPE